jgi:hypothetical protein
MPRIEIDATTLGPLFDARGPAAVRQFIREAMDDVSAQARSEVMQILNQRIRNPTPYYETQIMREKVTDDLFTVHDRDVIYGPWLEGTSERNRTTRFKGYAAFRKGMQAVQAKVPQLTAATLQRCIARLGGGGP